MPRFSAKIYVSGSLLVALALVMCTSGAALAQPAVQSKTVVVIGSAVIPGGNVQVARETAIKEGLVMAVARVTAELLQLDALVEHFPQVNTLIYNQPDQFIQNFKVLTETPSGKFYRVAVQVAVADQKIAQQLSKEGILRAEVALPSVVFLIAEQNVSEALPRYWWGIGMGGFTAVSAQKAAEVLKQRGFVVVNQSAGELYKSVDWLADAQPQLTDQQAAELGKNLKADVAIVGTSIASEAPNTMGAEMKTFKGMFAARVLRTATVEQLGAVSRDAVATSANAYEGGKQALAHVGTVAGSALAEQLSAEWRKLREKPSQLEMIIEGTNQLANFVKFRKALGSIPGVEGIQVKEIKPNQTTLIVDFLGKAENLASSLMLKTFETFGIDIYEVTETSLKIALISG